MVTASDAPRRTLIILIVMIIMIATSFNVRANEIDSAGYGGQIRAIKGKDLRIEREDLSFVYQRDTTRFGMVDVRAEYVVRNDGAARNIRYEFSYPAASSPATSIVVRVNGKAVQVTRSKQAKDQDVVYYFTARLVKGRNTIHHEFAKEASGTIFHDRVIGYRMSDEIDTFNVAIDIGYIGDQRLLMVPTSLTNTPAPSPWTMSTGGTIVDTICAREMWPTEDRVPGKRRCPDKEVLVIITPDGKLRYTAYGFTPTRDLVVLVANEHWLRTKAMRSAKPPPFPGQVHGVPR